MRIASLLPSATEIVCAIGLGGELVAVTHGCDWPPSVIGTPVVTADRIPAGARPPDLQERVDDALHGGSSVYALDEGALADARPDLILTQAGCRVCEVGYPGVAEIARRIDPDITVVSLEPTSLEGILNTISTIGAMTEAEDAAMSLVASLRERLGAVETRVAERRRAGHRPPRVVGVVWLDPPFATGHWVPEQIRRAGGWELMGADGGPARRTTWEAIVEVAPEMLFLLRAGDHLEATIQEWQRTSLPPELADVPAARDGAVVALDGSAYFNRPGPRVIDGVELLAEVMDPAGFMDLAPADGWAPVDLP
jgi:iron complex transport system substrate-binding protein